MKKMYVNIFFTAFVVVNLQNGKCKSHDNDIEYEDPVDKIMRERGLMSPHEVKMMDQAKDKYESNERFYHETDEIKHLKNELKVCKKRNTDLREALVQNAVNESLQTMQKDMPYLGQMYQGILNVWRQTDRSTELVKYITFQFANDSFETLEKCLGNGEHVEKCMDIISSILKTGKEEIPTRFVNKIFDILERVNLVVLSYVAIAVVVMALGVYSTILLITSKHTLLGFFIIFIWISFIVSVPWEWMHLYKKVIAEKMATKMSTSSECFKEKMSYLSLVKYWLQDSFSFSDNECLKYYNAEIVEPFWEVTPVQALAASASRLILQPMLVMSEHLGKCFRLIFKEIPIQWQLPVFIVIVVIIVIVVLFVMGLEISGPLFQIGRHGQVLRHQLEEKTNRIKELERQLDNVRRQEVLPRQNSIVPQTVIAPPAAGNMVENIPNNSQNIIRNAVENSYSSEYGYSGACPVNESRYENVINEQRDEVVVQETDWDLLTEL